MISILQLQGLFGWVEDVRHQVNNYLVKKPALTPLYIMDLSCCSIAELISFENSTGSYTGLTPFLWF